MKELTESKDLWVELKHNRPSYMVLKGTYGKEIHKTFRVTRQGVRWRFQRLFNRVYVEAFLTILMVEKIFGAHISDNNGIISDTIHLTPGRGNIDWEGVLKALEIIGYKGFLTMEIGHLGLLEMYDEDVNIEEHIRGIDGQRGQRRA